MKHPEFPAAVRSAPNLMDDIGVTVADLEAQVKEAKE